MKAHRGFWFLLFLLCSFFSVSLAAENISPLDPSKPIQTQVGKKFKIVMDANWTTGYQWRLDGDIDTGKIKRAGIQYLAGQTNLVGAPGVEIWSFDAVGAGETEISFKYVRSWEKDVPPANTRKFKIIVTP